MIFFTDITTDASRYCMLNVKRLTNTNRYKKELIFVDPGVYELKDRTEYSKVDLCHEIAKNQSQFISIDYPCDMNLPASAEFIEKSIRNNLRYKENPYYICTVQSKFRNYADFCKQFLYLHEEIDFTQKIVGIGNLCRIMTPNTFTDYLFAFLRKYKWYHYHFYGLSLALIEKYLPAFPHVSVDSTKWTRAADEGFKRKNGVMCRKHNRDLYFLYYMDRIQQTIPNLIF
jgi:hypothetical protein